MEKLSLPAQTGLLESLCRASRNLQQYFGEGVQNEEQIKFRQRIRELTANILQQYAQKPQESDKAQTLIAVMDAYEICGSEADLQTALTYAEKLLRTLNDSSVKCKLLSYCYYYIEEPACADHAKYIIDKWDRISYRLEMIDAIKCYHELV